MISVRNDVDIQGAGSVVPVCSVGDPVLEPPPRAHLPGERELVWGRRRGRRKGGRRRRRAVKFPTSAQEGKGNLTRRGRRVAYGSIIVPWLVA